MRANGFPEVSVVIPTRNRAALLTTRALRAALAQRGVTIEVIVVDDGSTDSTIQAVQRVNDPRVRYVRHVEPQGVPVARNAGLAIAQGAWVAFLDDDDVWAPDKLRTQLDLLNATRTAWSYTGVLMLDEQLRVLREEPLPEPAVLERDLLRYNVVPAGSSSVVARAELVREVGGFDPELSQMADWDLWLTLARRGQAACVAAPLVGYVRHRGSMLIVDQRDVIQEIDRVASRHGGVDANPDRIWFVWAAEGHRRAGRRVAASRLYLRGARRYRARGLLIRAALVLLGERVMRLAHAVRVRLRPEDAPLVPPSPGWLDLYRVP